MAQLPVSPGEITRPSSCKSHVRPDGQAHEPAAQEVVAQLLAQLPLAADQVEHLHAATTTDFGTASVGLHEHLDGDSGLVLHNLQLSPGRFGRLTACLLPILKRLDT